MGGIYLITLAQATKSPFEPRSDEVALKGAEKGKGKPDEKKEAEKQVTVTVDPEGIGSRIAALPVQGAAYRNLESAGEKLYYIRGGSKDEKPRLLVYELDKQKETDLGEAGGFEISADGKKMLVSQSGEYAIIDAPTSKIDAKEHLSLAEMKVTLDLRAEWNQIFHECWRQMRDFMYDPHLQGVDWEGVRKKYEVLLPFVNHRADLTYVIGEMISELNIGHSYVGGGQYPKPERIATGLLGAKIERDPSSRYFRITEILKGENWDRNARSPLTEIGVSVKEGDYIIAVNGKTTNAMPDIYEALVNTPGHQVTLRVNGEPREEGSHETVVVPTADEHELYYLKWIEGNIEKVSKATGGKIGYIHIPDMGTEGLNTFAKYFYPQTRKEGLIVDVRGNGGGNVSPQIIERLRRQFTMIDVARNAAPSPDPAGTILGPKVMLIDEFSASDGDIVAYRFRKNNLGPLIGKRTWGGVVGIRGTLPLLDGGFLNRPEFSRYDVEGKEWIMEGKGVEPDIVVDNDPAREYAGVDDQLNKAIEVIMKELKDHPVVIPPPPPYPDRSR
jgi:tricorn protease